MHLGELTLSRGAHTARLACFTGVVSPNSKVPLVMTSNSASPVDDQARTFPSSESSSSFHILPATKKSTRFENKQPRRFSVLRPSPDLLLGQRILCLPCGAHKWAVRTAKVSSLLVSWIPSPLTYLECSFLQRFLSPLHCQFPSSGSSVLVQCAGIHDRTAKNSINWPFLLFWPPNSKCFYMLRASILLDP